MLDRLDVLIDQVVAKERDAPARFRAHREMLHTALLHHMNVEEALILPLLRTADGGTGRANELVRHHEAQRRWLARVLSPHGGPLDEFSLRDVRAMGNLLRIDMDHEERELLHPRSFVQRKSA